MWNKTSWLSVDWSAAVAVCSAPKSHAAWRHRHLNPRQSWTCDKVTHHISFSSSISGDEAFFVPACVSPLRGSRHTAKCLFNPRTSVFWRNVCGRSVCLRYRTAGEKLKLWFNIGLNQNTHRTLQIKAFQTVLREGFLLFWRCCSTSPIEWFPWKPPRVVFTEATVSMCVCAYMHVRAF